MTDATAINYDKMMQHVRAAQHPLVFVTISGAHLYGFPSPDSDFDLRGVNQPTSTQSCPSYLRPTPHLTIYWFV